MNGFQLLVIVIVIYLWNRFVVPFFMAYIIDNRLKSIAHYSSLNKSMYEWARPRKQLLIKAVQGFYWLGLLMIITVNLLSEKP